MDIFWPFGFLSWFHYTKQTINFPAPLMALCPPMLFEIPIEYDWVVPYGIGIQVQCLSVPFGD